MAGTRALTTASRRWLPMPPRVDYSLTPLGEDLAEVMVPLLWWVARHADEIIG